MSKKGTDIVKIDIKKLVSLMNKALADEWLAYYQYWIGAQVVRGPTQPEVAAELNQHATEELGHALLLVGRIIQLGGTPILDPAEFGKLSNCGYAAPKDPHVKAILKQNIEGERCAIEVYDKLLAMVKDKDDITYNLILSILTDEVTHETDLENLLDNLSEK
jgi:bacterioferritin